LPRSFASLRISPAGSRYAHARNAAQVRIPPSPPVLPGSFAALRISPAGSRYAHARNAAQVRIPDASCAEIAVGCHRDRWRTTQALPGESDVRTGAACAKAGADRLHTRARQPTKGSTLFKRDSPEWAEAVRLRISVMSRMITVARSTQQRKCMQDFEKGSKRRFARIDADMSGGKSRIPAVTASSRGARRHMALAALKVCPYADARDEPTALLVPGGRPNLMVGRPYHQPVYAFNFSANALRNFSSLGAMMKRQ
jgi:hypothetical protein